MTIVYKGIPTQVTTKNAAMTELDQSTIEQVKQVTNASGLVTVTTYRVTSGVSPADGMYVVVRHEYTPSDQTRISIRLLTNVEDDALEDILVGSYEVGLFLNFPGTYPIAVDQLMAMAECTVGLLIASYDASTGVPDTSILEKLAFGITHELWD